MRQPIVRRHSGCPRRRRSRWGRGDMKTPLGGVPGGVVVDEVAAWWSGCRGGFLGDGGAGGGFVGDGLAGGAGGEQGGDSYAAACAGPAPPPARAGPQRLPRQAGRSPP